VRAATLPVDEALSLLTGTAGGLTHADAAERLARVGPNAVRDHRTRAWSVLARQVRSPLLLLLAGTAVVSFFVGEPTTAIIIGVILAASVGLGFGNEYRAEQAARAMHTRLRHTVVALRDGRPERVDVTDLVPGDVVRLALGAVVPADLRLMHVVGLQCDESMLTGESVPVDKSADPVVGPHGVTELSSCALMGTIVRAGSGTGVVVATGGRAEFGRIALALGTRQPETDFQVGLRKFSGLLLQVALVLTTLILVTNLLLQRPLIDAILFSLAIAVGITPQLLPAVVSTSLAAGSRRLAASKVLVKRLICIEDLGDLDVLVTDKTGTLTEGAITFAAALDGAGEPSDATLRLGLLATDVDLRDGVAVAATPWTSPCTGLRAPPHRTVTGSPSCPSTTSGRCAPSSSTSPTGPGYWSPRARPRRCWRAAPTLRPGCTTSWSASSRRARASSPSPPGPRPASSG